MMSRLTVSSRDALLERLDERTTNMWHVLDEKDDSINKKIDKILAHQEKQNGKIMKNRMGLIGLICLLVGLGILNWQDIIHIIG